MKCSLLFVLLMVTSPVLAQWKIPEVAMMTRWGKQLTPENAWQEYPRPQFRREQNWKNLNGLWDYAVTRDATQPDSFDGKLLVPFAIESALSGVGHLLEPNETLWYRRTFNHQSPADQRTLLNFEAVDYACTVFINGIQVGQHIGSSDPFKFDITDALQEGDDYQSSQSPVDRDVGSVQ